MNKIKKLIFPLIARGMSTERLLKQSKHPVLIHPLYHAVTDSYRAHLHPICQPRPFRRFQNDIEYFCNHFQAIDANEVLAHVRREQLIQKNAFHLSFDDSLREVYTIVLPYLYRKGIPATVFINSDFVNNKQLFYKHKASLIVDKLNKTALSAGVRQEVEKIVDNPVSKTLQEKILAITYVQRSQLDEIAALLEIDFEEYLKRRKPYLSIKEIHELQKNGFTIGAHSIDNPPFLELTEEDQLHQIVSSMAYVRQATQEEHHYFSFPGSAEGISEWVFRSLYRKTKKGIELSFGVGGIGTRFKGKYMKRIDMEASGDEAKKIIHQAIVKYYLTFRRM